jgi:hypothetical protein
MDAIGTRGRARDLQAGGRRLRARIVNADGASEGWHGSRDLAWLARVFVEVFHQCDKPLKEAPHGLGSDNDTPRSSALAVPVLDPQRRDLALPTRKERDIAVGDTVPQEADEIAQRSRWLIRRSFRSRDRPALAFGVRDGD